MGISKLILKFTQGCKRPRKSQHNNEGEENSWRIKLPGFKTYQKAKILKTMLYGPKKKEGGGKQVNGREQRTKKQIYVILSIDLGQRSKNNRIGQK